MRSKKNIETLKLDDGVYHEKVFTTYLDMAKHAVDWTIFCFYQLQPKAISGIYKILSLPSIQIAYTEACGGVMYDYVAPENCINISIMYYISNKACIDEMKLKTDMIVIVDDQKIYNFMYNAQVRIFDISIKKSAHPRLIEKLTKSINKYYIDDDKQIALMLKDILSEYNNDIPLDIQTSSKIESKVIKIILNLLEKQEVQIPHFTKSELIALKMKNEIFKHADGNMSIKDLSKKHLISERSLQNSFKSLFDLKPKQFMRLLKLNLVHHELLKSHKEKITVQKIAQKWGFMHMGRFSKFYTELFLENPSLTLKRVNPNIDEMHKHCVERKEEMIDIR